MNPLKNIDYFEVLPSTNDYIKQNLDSLEPGGIVHAFDQTHGRGRRNNIWQSKSGENLTFSFYDQTDNHDTSHYLVTTALSVVNVLKQKNVNAWIKLPNDIMVDNKKIAGILIETIHKDSLIHVVVGVGLNINQVFLGPLKNKATSLKILLNTDCVKEEYLKGFMDAYNTLILKEYGELFKAFKNHLKLGTIKAHYDGKILAVTDIDESFMCEFNQKYLPCTLLDFNIIYKNYK